MRRLAALGVFALLVPATARANERDRFDGDGAYGRLDGDVALVAGVDGGMVASGGRKLLGADLRLRYFDSAGLAFGYEESGAFASASATGDLLRSYRAGVELRPLFPARFLKNREIGVGFIDLVLDSIGLDVAAVWSVRKDVPSSRPGFLAGFALEAPLTARASGPWVRFATSMRWTAQTIEGGLASDPGGRTVVLTLGLAWHQFVDAHLADREDRHLR